MSSSSAGDDPEVADRPLCFSAAELEFLAEDELIEVKPSFSQLEGVPLLGGAIAPFQPGRQPAKVPLWMAIQMKKQRRCEVVPPAWLSLPALDQWLEQESTEERFGAPPCPCFVEVARVLLSYAREDLGPQADLIEVRMRDIRDRREAKMQSGLRLMNDDVGSFIKLGRMGSAEINTIRSFAQESLSKFNRLHSVATLSADMMTQSQAVPDATRHQPAAAREAFQQQLSPPPMAGVRAVQAAAPIQAASQRRGANFRQNGAAPPAASYAAPSQLDQPSQPGAAQPPGTAATAAGGEQARKLRRFN